MIHQGNNFFIKFFFHIIIGIIKIMVFDIKNLITKVIYFFDLTHFDIIIFLLNFLIKNN